MRIVIFMPLFASGGIERMYNRLAGMLVEQGHAVTMLVCAKKGPEVATVPGGVEIETLPARKTSRSVPSLLRYVRRHRPDVILSGHDHSNIALCLLGILAPGLTKTVVSQHHALSMVKRDGLKGWATLALYRLLLNRASAVVAVSQGVARDLAAHTRLALDEIQVIYNGAVPDDIDALCGPPPSGVEAPGQPKPRNIIAIGRMVWQKDFATLIAAFAKLSERIEARLTILGDGPLRDDLAEQARALSVGDRVAMPGYVENPFPHIARSDLLVVSSHYEGFGNVVVEALACGTPVVSTDCEHGPAEILDGGRYGRLVPVEDSEALAEAMHAELLEPHPAEELRRRGGDFGENAMATAYLRLFEELAGR